MATKKDTGEVQIVKLKQGSVIFHILGDTPLIMNRQSEKTKRELLYPAGRKTSATKAQKLKHDPMEEYRNSAYAHGDSSQPAALFFPSSAFKRAAATAALELPGAKKAQINRLMYVVGESVQIYGIPQLFMCSVRTADMNRTPDIRTRAILPKWAAEVTVRYIEPQINVTSVGNLFGAAGVMVGVGDDRVEKGRSSFGQFSLVDADDKAYTELVKKGGFQAQHAALEDPLFYNAESEELFNWFISEIGARGDADKRRAHLSAAS